MAPNIVYMGAVCLAALQTTQAFMIPSSFTFPGIKKGPSGNTGVKAVDGEPVEDVVSILPIPKEDPLERMKNLQLGVSRPFPFSVPSGDIKEANQKAKNYFRKACKKFKHDASKIQHDAAKFGNKAEAELEDLDRKILAWWKETVPSKVEEFEQQIKDFESEVEEEIKDNDWYKYIPSSVKGDATAQKSQEESSSQEGIQAFSVSFFPDEDGNADDSNGIYLEVVNLETGEVTRERLDIEDFDLFGNTEHYEQVDDEEVSQKVPMGSPFHGISDLDVNPEWQEKIRLSPHAHHKMRCMASRFRRAMHSVATALRAFITGFLIPVLIGVAAGMAASLFGMLVGTLCGWLWVKLFGRRAENEVEFVEYRPASDGFGEKDTLLVVENVDSDEDAPPVYVEKE